MNNFNYNAITNFFDRNSKIPSEEILDNIQQLIRDIKAEDPGVVRQQLIENVAGEILKALPQNREDFAYFVGRQLVDASGSKNTSYHALGELISLMLLEKVSPEDSNPGADSLSPVVRKAFSDLKYLINKSWQNAKKLPYFQDQVPEIKNLTLSNLTRGELAPLMSVSKAMNKTAKLNLIRGINDGTIAPPVMTFEEAKKNFAGHESKVQRLHLEGPTPTEKELSTLFPNLTHLSYGGKNRKSSRGADFSFLSHMENLKHLELFDYGKLEMGDKELRHIGFLQNLESLSIIECGSWSLSSKRFEFLPNLKALKSLKIADGMNEQTSDQCLTFLSQMTQLEDLNLQCYKLTNNTFKQLVNLENMKNLGLYSPNIEDEDLHFLENMPHLQTLNLHGGKITDDGLQYLKDCKQLTELDLSFCPLITGDGFVYFADLNELKIINLECPLLTSSTRGDVFKNELSDTALSFLKNKTKMENLNLNGCHLITDEGLSHLAGMHNLKTLKLSGMENVTEDGLVDVFKHMRHIQSLSITKCPNIKNVIFLSNMSELKFLELSWPSQTESLEGLHNLEEIDLSYTNVSDNDLEPLKKFKKLKIVKLPNNNFKSELVRDLKVALPNVNILYGR